MLPAVILLLISAICSSATAISGNSNTRKHILVMKHKTVHAYATCIDQCNSSRRCRTVLEDNVECFPEEYVYFAQQPTLDGELCATVCIKLSSTDKAPKCYKDNGVLVLCKPFEDKRNFITQLTRDINTYGTYTKDGYRICRECVRGHRVRRQVNFLHKEINVNAVLAAYESEFPVNNLRYLNPQIVDPNEINPVLNFIMFPIPGVILDTQTFLPLSVTALITNYTRPTSKRSYTVRVNMNYQNMQPVHKRDEKCHIVGHRFNGPIEMFNIFPCTWDMNHGGGSEWNLLERDMSNFVSKHANGYIEFTAVLSYDFDHPIHPFRPNALGLRMRYYNNQHVLSDKNGVPLGNKRNPYENMYFNNDPEFCCSAELQED